MTAAGWYDQRLAGRTVIRAHGWRAGFGWTPGFVLEAPAVRFQVAWTRRYGRRPWLVRTRYRWSVYAGPVSLTVTRMRDGHPMTVQHVGLFQIQDPADNLRMSAEWALRYAENRETNAHGYTTGGPVTTDEQCYHRPDVLVTCWACPSCGVTRHGCAHHCCREQA